jgi:LysR family glycine cleavage system transcriptional activator
MQTPALRFLKTFHVAAKLGSFKAAAEELCVTASAVSHQIKALEQQLGVTLFNRGARSLSLSAAGANYLENIDAVFSRLELVTEQLKRRYSRAVVRLQVPPFFASELLVPRLSNFGALHNDIDIQIETDLAPNKEHCAEADVSVVVGTGQWTDVQSTRLFPQAYAVACAPERLQQAHIELPDDLLRQPLIAHARRRDLWDRWAAMMGLPPLRPKQIIEFNSMASIVAAAEQGVGIALVSAPVAVQRFAKGSLVRVFERELSTGDAYYLVTRPEDAQRQGVRALIGWMLQQYGAGSWLPAPAEMVSAA